MDYTFLFYMLAIPLFLVGLIYVQVRMMSNPEKMMQPIAGGFTSDKMRILNDHQHWLTSHNLRYVTCFKFGAIQVAAYQQTDVPRFFCFYFGQSISYDITTHFDETNALTTANSGSIGMFPITPGSYKQSFPGANAEVLWQKHLEAEMYLMNKFGLRFEPVTKAYEQRVIEGIRKQMAHVRSIPFYPFLALYWFAVTRKRMANLSIQQQFP
jgi:hypothetical protein